jgi:hypothetical protein
MPRIIHTFSGIIAPTVYTAADAYDHRLTNNRMVDINYSDTDWIVIRQSLSLALASGRSVSIGGAAAFLGEGSDYRPILDDIARILPAIGAGRIRIEGDTIIFDPENLAAGKYDIETGPLSSATEPILLLMPALFNRDFRSIITASGVTHSHLSCPSAFIKETVLAGLEKLGLYGSLMLRRFGFYGTGGGSMEARIYPRESGAEAMAGSGRPALLGAKIFISHVDASLAEMEKSMLAGLPGFDQVRIAIIEVMESNGAGNSIQVFGECSGMTVVLFRDMRLYNLSGEFIFSEDALRGAIDGLAADARSFLEGSLPERIIRELYPYRVMAGKTPQPGVETRGIEMTRGLCEKLL